MTPVAPASGILVCDEVQQHIVSVCVISSGPSGMGSGCTQPTVTGLPMQENHSDCCRVAQHALVLGSVGHVKPHPTVPS